MGLLRFLVGMIIYLLILAVAGLYGYMWLGEHLTIEDVIGMILNYV